MRIIFLLDSNEFVEVAPDKLLIRQIKQDVAALGVEVLIPVTKEDGSPDLNEAGSPKTQIAFKPFINYSVNLSLPEPVEEPKKKASKRKAGN